MAESRDKFRIFPQPPGHVDMETRVLLVKDIPAEKSQSSFAGLRASVKPVNALKGELMIAIPGDKLVPSNDGGKPHNYQLARDTTVSLRAEADDIAPLNPHELAVLEAVKVPHIRYSVFIQVEAMRQFEKENEEKMRTKVQQNPGHFQQSASSPHYSPRLILEAQHQHGRQPHQQPQPSQLTSVSHLQPSDSNIPSTVALGPDPALALGIGSMVQVSGRYGILQWIGNFTEVPGIIAGVELEEGMNGCTDGSRNGVQYFTCKPGRGFFCPLSSLRPDERFTMRPDEREILNPLWECPNEEIIDQHGEDIDVEKYVGEERGIQGHQNSSYLDATVFGLFAVSDVFDSVFLTAPDADVSEILWKRIVNPLRKHGVVRYESVMALRNKLEEIGKMKGVNQDKKDPEEFLNMLFKHALHVKPFITIKRPFCVEQEYFVQLFLEFDERVKIPSVGSFLTKMFKEQSTSFTEAPSKLLIQIPRFGKKFKPYDKIVPDLQLDIGELLPSPYKCLVCSEPARNKCNSCLVNGSANSVYFCDVCCDRAHSEATKRQVETTTTNTSSMQLLSVICIEISHYVCFTHSGGRWIFMDSMANRVHDTYNIPREWTALRISMSGCTLRIRPDFSPPHFKSFQSMSNDLPKISTCVSTLTLILLCMLEGLRIPLNCPTFMSFLSLRSPVTAERARPSNGATAVTTERARP